MAIRYSTEHDVSAEAVHALFQTAVFSRGRRLDDIRHALAHSSYIVTAWDVDALVGLARVLDDGQWYATIWDVMVHPDYQGRGIGKRLMELAVAPYRGKDYQFVALFAAEGRVPFYEQLGFVVHPRGMVVAAEYRGTPLQR